MNNDAWASATNIRANPSMTKLIISFLLKKRQNKLSSSSVTTCNIRTISSNINWERISIGKDRYHRRLA